MKDHSRRSAFRNLTLTLCATLPFGCNTTSNPFSSENREEPVVVPQQPERLEIEQHGGRKVTAMLKDAQHVFSTQETDLWCWAACASMLHALNGDEISQKEIVDRVQGVEGLEEGRERGASFFEIVRALTPEIGEATFNEVFAGRIEDVWSDFSEKGEVIGGARVEPSALVRGFMKEHVTRPKNPAIEDLWQGHAAFVGLKEPDADLGHAYVMIGATFTPPSDELLKLLEAAKKVDNTPSPLRVFLPRSALEIQADIARITTWYDRYEDLLSDPDAQLLFNRVGFDRYNTESVVLLDPYEEDFDSARTVLSGPEFMAQAQFVLTASDAKEIAEKWTKALEVETKSLIPDNAK